MRDQGTGDLLAFDPVDAALQPTTTQPAPEGPSTWPKLPAPPAPGPGIEVLGHWRRVLQQPGTQRVLAQWSGECEVPRAFVLETPPTSPRAVTGEKDWTQAPESFGLGWTKDGRAIVQLLGGACGFGAPKPGVYLVDPVLGSATFITEADSARAWSDTDHAAVMRSR